MNEKATATMYGNSFDYGNPANGIDTDAILQEVRTNISGFRDQRNEDYADFASGTTQRLDDMGVGGGFSDPGGLGEFLGGAAASGFYSPGASLGSYDDFMLSGNTAFDNIMSTAYNNYAEKKPDRDQDLQDLLKEISNFTYKAGEYARDPDTFELTNPGGVTDNAGVGSTLPSISSFYDPADYGQGGVGEKDYDFLKSEGYSDAQIKDYALTMEKRGYNFGKGLKDILNVPYGDNGTSALTDFGSQYPGEGEAGFVGPVQEGPADAEIEAIVNGTNNNAYGQELDSFDLAEPVRVRVPGFNKKDPAASLASFEELYGNKFGKDEYKAAIEDGQDPEKLAKRLLKYNEAGANIGDNVFKKMGYNVYDPSSGPGPVNYITSANTGTMFYPSSVENGVRRYF